MFITSLLIYRFFSMNKDVYIYVSDIRIKLLFNLPATASVQLFQQNIQSIFI